MLTGFDSPGIGISIAKRFATQHFDTIALCSRSSQRLSTEKADVEDAASKAGRNIKVHTFTTDLSDLDSLQRTLEAIGKLGPLGCIYHNAARIKPTETLTTTVAEIEEDFKVPPTCTYVDNLL